MILTYSSLAATSAASPLPWVDIPVVMAHSNAGDLSALADLYDQKMNAGSLAEDGERRGGRFLPPGSR